MSRILQINTPGRSLTDITAHAADYVAEKSAKNGILHLFAQHTSASLIIQENADPDVCADMIDFFDQVAPQSAHYRHSAEGPDDMPAHIKTALTQTALAVPVMNGRLAMGTWQGIYLFEHRRQSHRRNIVMMFQAIDE